MDEGFAFSFSRTREEWDEEERRRKAFDEEFNRTYAAQGDQFSADEMLLADEYGGDKDGE
jgi:hypothetical protein